MSQSLSTVFKPIGQLDVADNDYLLLQKTH